MSKRRYRFTVTNLADLAKAYPQAVDTNDIPEQVIPARTETKANYVNIAKLLDLGFKLPGIEMIDDDKPAFLHNVEQK